MIAEPAALLSLARLYCEKEGIGLRGLEKRSGRDGLFRRLEAGKSCRPKNINAAFEWLASNWPIGTPWPDDVVRPEAPEIEVEAVAVIEETEMPVLFEESDEQEAERLAEERADALFRARLEAERKRSLSRRQEAEKIREARALLERADPTLIAEENYRAAIADVPLYADSLRQSREPSLGGLTDAQMEEVGRKQASAEQQFRNEEAARKRWVASQEEAIRNLCAGQSEETQRLIRAQFNAQKGG